MPRPRFASIVVLTGAGVSAESGISTFRDPDGIWARVDYREVATPEGFARNPQKVHDFYNMRRRALFGVEPNAAHEALARLEREFSGEFLLVTQNVDALHERAGSRKLLHMHGEHASALCAACGERGPWSGDLHAGLACDACAAVGTMRPDVVWFGEMPYHLDRIHSALAAADLFVAIGTSGSVYPAAQFVRQARAGGARTVELNLEPSLAVDDFDEAIHGKATEIVPAFVDRVLKGR
jgi:NAD-dependent deacetylase